MRITCEELYNGFMVVFKTVKHLFGQALIISTALREAAARGGVVWVQLPLLRKVSMETEDRS